jgi:type II restriction enzyme
MNLQCSTELASAYKSGSQIARILTEAWCARELYCPACVSDRLLSSKVNTPVIDFTCPVCGQLFQLKSLRRWNPKTIPDAGYDSMLRSIRADKVPNLLVLQYLGNWSVRNLLLVPSFFFSESIIEKRTPLGPHARRAGWVGCNILLGQIPDDGRIALVSDGLPAPTIRVRGEFARMRSLGGIPPSVRGWTLDVFKIVRRLAKQRFRLKDLYEFEDELQAEHPSNKNVRPKIRQQLQVLRDIGLLDFTAPGEYTLKA